MCQKNTLKKIHISFQAYKFYKISISLGEFKQLDVITKFLENNAYLYIPIYSCALVLNLNISVY